MILLPLYLIRVALFSASFVCGDENPGSETNNMSMKLPEGFLLGVGSSSYQIEGAAFEDNKGESIWDRFVRTRTDLIVDGSNGDVACDSYHKYEDDIKILKDLGVDFYRFSISWPRILPNGDISNINQAGIDYYNKVINGLIENGIQPMVTMYHWELPQNLQEIGGWTNPVLADFFEDYADILFKNFGDRVKWWCTINEPHLHSVFGHGQAAPDLPIHAPGLNYTGTAEYLAGKTQLVSHARAYRLYEKHYLKEQGGKLGIVLDTFYYRYSSESGMEAAERAKAFEYGWFLNPIYSAEGGYPALMSERIMENSKAEGRKRSRLPELTKEEIDLIKGTSDFLGVNHYTTYYAEDMIAVDKTPSFFTDAAFNSIPNSETKTAEPSWIKVEPEGFRELLVWIKDTYNNPTVIITENGCGDAESINDYNKINYHKKYIKEVIDAINEDECKIIGYSAWSLMDSYEWTSGYTEKFGFYHVDFTDPDRKRTPKLSALFYKELLKTRTLVI